jgi:hypothetical protein
MRLFYGYNLDVPSETIPDRKYFQETDRGRIFHLWQGKFECFDFIVVRYDVQHLFVRKGVDS